MSKNIIKLNEDYGIHCDEYNIILCERKVNETKGSKNYGVEYYTNIGYYSTTEALLKGIINKQIQLGLKEQKTLESLVNSVETYVSLLHDNVKAIVKTLREDC